MARLHPQLQRCYDLALRGAFKHPFFLIPLGHCEWVEGDPTRIPTMAVLVALKEVGGEVRTNPEIVIRLYINPEFARKLTDAEIFGALCHEILHVLLRHGDRVGGRVRETWAIATDMAINAALRESRLALPNGALYPPPGYNDLTAEELYDQLQSGGIKKPDSFDADRVGSGCLPEAGEIGADSQARESRALGELLAKAQAQGRGSETNKALERLLTPVPLKTPWSSLLRIAATRAKASGGRDNQTFTRPNRRSGGSEFVLPGWHSNTPSIAVIIDSSGSVSEEMLRASISSARECLRVSEVRVYLALHEWECYYADWISSSSSAEKLARLPFRRGGTNPEPAFRKVGEARSKFDVCVYLTDGEVGHYPACPPNVRKMIVGIVGDRPYRAAVPLTWQEVLVEVA